MSKSRRYVKFNEYRSSSDKICQSDFRYTKVKEDKSRSGTIYQGQVSYVI